MKKKINLRFLSIVAVAISATVVLTTVIFYEVFKREVMQGLQTYAKLLVSTSAYKELDTKTLREELGELRVTIIDGTGTVVFDSNVDIGGLENHGQRPEVEQAFQKGEGSIIRKSDTLEKTAFYYAVRLKDGSVLRVAKESHSIMSVYMNAFPAMGVVCVVLFIVCAVISHLLTKSLIHPIEELANHLDDEVPVVYKELAPFMATIRKQHENIMNNATMRQEFTANVSHELKTPLAAISGYSELIENGMATDEDVIRFASEIHRNCNRLLTLINDTIRLSELDHAEQEVAFERVNVYQVAKNCVDMLQMNAKKHQVSLQIEGEKAYVMANKGMMEEVIYNLCDNAMRYNKEDGSVIVGVFAREAEHKVIVSVKDTGIGISKENQERVFERFYRVDKSRSKVKEGTGLGLAIVKHIVALHKNATLELESEVGVGTEIRIVFDIRE